MTRPLHPTALVTGGNRGIGHAIAQGLIAKGCQVTIGARNPDEGRKAAVKAKVDSAAAAAGLDRALVARLYEDLIETSIAHEFASWDLIRGD